MHRALILTTLLPLLALCGACQVREEQAPPALELPDGWERAAASIEPQGLLESVRFLASDDMEGRGPGTSGDRKARAYLAQRLEQAGFEPAFDGDSWEQPFGIVGIRTLVPEEWTFVAGDGSEIEFLRSEDFMAASGVQREDASLDDAEVVFVGYGIQAPEQGWDDFKEIDLRGKLLLMLNDDPDWDPELFGGERKLYYGRWTYKYESAARQGAAGAVILHTTPSAGYPWEVVQTSWSGEQFEAPAGEEPRLALQGWLTEPAARRLVALAGQDLDQLIRSARSREFRPVPLGVSTSIRLEAEIRSTETANVGGMLRGSDPELADEWVVYTAHHDHLGLGEPDTEGDRIYNGALDNGVALAQALAMAQAYSALPERTRRSVMVLFVAAEEQGLLGSQHFVRHPPVPLGRIAADINFELGNVWGRTRDVTVFGMGKSELEDLLRQAAASQERVVAGESDLKAGWYYRSDQFSFARAGVPAIWFKSGTDFIGRPPGWGESTYAGWIERNYHRPSDEVEPDWKLEGLAEDARLAFQLGLAVAGSDATPRWYPGDEFEEVRRRSLRGLD